MTLDISPLGNAIGQLEKSLVYANSSVALAEAVFAVASDFLIEAQALLKELTRRGPASTA